MSKFKTARTLWQKDKIRLLEPIFFRLQQKGLLNWMSDNAYLKCAFRFRMGYSLDLKNPRTFCEKLQWLKLHDRQPEYHKMVDKYEAKKYVSEKIGGYIIPTFGVWDKVEDIEWSTLPNKFVLKTTGGSGGFDVIICRDKATFNKEEANSKLKKSLKKNAFWYGREWPYKGNVNRIMAEELLEDGNQECVRDYKFFCFNGEPKIMYISNDFSSQVSTDFFDMNFNRLDLKMKDPNSIIPPDKPKRFDEMRSLAKKLSSGMPCVRVDFYLSNDCIYFGELTFYHNSGFFHITPAEWDNIIGDWITIPS